MPDMISARGRLWRVASVVAAAVLVSTGGVARADDPPGNVTVPPDDGVQGDSDKSGNISASAAHSRIQITYLKGGDSGGSGSLAPIDSDWEPPACWYEPVFTPKELRDFVNETGGAGDVGIHESWYGEDLWTDHYRDGKPDDHFNQDIAKGYENYNIGKGGYFWRGVAPDPHDPDSWDCGRIMFWQPENEIPDLPNAPTPEMLASYAYDEVKVPETEVELNPEATSTVNLPTWVWLDGDTFQDVVVRAELPRAGLWAETTATPVSLHLDPGTEDARTYPSSGTCEFNEDGSIGTPYTEGADGKNPPCGVTYLRASGGQPYDLEASITWKITWEGSGGTSGSLPSGTFETTQEIPVQEIQSIVR